MTDKQIFIDGCDVSRCIYFKMNNKMPMCRACNSGIGSPYCEYHKDCYYKRFKAKEQECNKFYIQLKADEEYHKEEKKILRKIIKNKEKRNIELYKENNKLNVKNDELKEKLKELRQGWINCDKERNLQEANSEFRQRVINRYKQTLIEIEKIVEPFCNACQEFEPEKRGSDCIYCNYGKILQKIKEVE